MKAPLHHPPEELLFDYATGAVGEAVGLVVATHLALCPTCRAEVALLDELGGALLGGIEAAPPSDTAVETARASVARLAVRPPPARRPAPPELIGYPEPLRSYLAPSGRLTWSFNLPGVLRYRDLDVSYGAVPLRVASLRGGLEIPRHTHQGLELNLVLQGGFTDRGAEYRRGDVAVADPSVTHRLDVHRGEPCVLLVLSEHRLVPTTGLGRLLSKMLPF